MLPGLFIIVYSNQENISRKGFQLCSLSNCSKLQNQIQNSVRLNNLAKTAHLLA